MVRDDLDSEKTKRVKNGTMRRDKITEKRNLSFAMLPMPEELAAQLDSDLHAKVVPTPVVAAVRHPPGVVVAIDL